MIAAYYHLQINRVLLLKLGHLLLELSLSVEPGPRLAFELAPAFRFEPFQPSPAVEPENPRSISSTG